VWLRRSGVSGRSFGGWVAHHPAHNPPRACVQNLAHDLVGIFRGRGRCGRLAAWCLLHVVVCVSGCVGNLVVPRGMRYSWELCELVCVGITKTGIVQHFSVVDVKRCVSHGRALKWMVIISFESKFVCGGSGKTLNITTVYRAPIERWVHRHIVG
jgi:hypothetical protein